DGHGNGTDSDNTADELDGVDDLDEIDRTPRDHARQGAPSAAEASRRAGPPPPPNAPVHVDRRTPPTANDDVTRIAEAKAQAEPSMPRPSSSGSGTTTDVQEEQAESESENSLTWSETSLYLEGPALQSAVERLHTLYRAELQVRRIPSRSQAGCLAGLRRRTNVSDWFRLQEEAVQRLTGDRLLEWQSYEHEATHERRRKTCCAHGNGRPVKHLNVLSWNTSGLSSAMFQELLAWTEAHSAADIIILQETHWDVTSDFQSGQWMAIHSSGKASPDPYGRYTGLLFLLHRQRFQALLQQHSLCVLNTWHCKPSGTYFSPTGYTQIDYVITRQHGASHQAKQAYPDHSFPIGSLRLTGHFPVRAQLPMQSFKQTAKQEPSQGVAIDCARLQAAVCQASPEALGMQASIAQRLQEVDISHLSSAHNHVNRILLEEAQQAFPKQVPTDLRVSANPGFCMSAKHVWQLYRQLKRPGVCATHTIFAKWKLAASFAKASKQLRQQSRDLKKQFYEAQVDQAEQAALRGDQRSLHLIVRRLSSKTRQIASRLRGEDGHLLTSQEELQHIMKHGSSTFAAQLDDHPMVPLQQALLITDQDLAHELCHLGLAKAVPKHIAPATLCLRQQRQA
ncbi:Pol, partial [Symbiodinium sp. CCMP2456]